MSYDSQTRANKKRWRDPKFRARMLGVLEKNWNHHRTDKAFARRMKAIARKTSDRPGESEARSARAKAQWGPGGSLRAAACCPETVKAAAIKRSKTFASKPNRQELKLYLALARAGIKYKRQFLVSFRGSRSYTIADAFIPSANLLIYTDGQYWHRPKRAEDLARRKKTETLGYDLFVIDQSVSFEWQFSALLDYVRWLKSISG